MRTVVVVLSSRGLTLALRLQAVLPGETRVFGPSCVVGACRGPIANGRVAPGLTFPSGNPGVFGWSGSIRKVLPAIRRSADASVALMPVGVLAKLALPEGPGAFEVALDDSARFAVSLRGGEDTHRLTLRVAEALGASALVISPEGTLPGWPAAWGRSSTEERAGTGS